MNEHTDHHDVHALDYEAFDPFSTLAVPTLAEISKSAGKEGLAKFQRWLTEHKVQVFCYAFASGERQPRDKETFAIKVEGSEKKVEYLEYALRFRNNIGHGAYLLKVTAQQEMPFHVKMTRERAITIGGSEEVLGGNLPVTVEQELALFVPADGHIDVSLTVERGLSQRLGSNPEKIAFEFEFGFLHGEQHKMSVRLLNVPRYAPSI